MEHADIYKQMPVLHTSRLTLRPLKSSDATDIFAYCSDREMTRYTIWETHQTIADTEAFLNGTFAQYERGEVSPWGMVEKQSGQIIGTVGFISWDTVNDRAELGYALSRSCWGKGYMSEAVQELVKFGFERMELVRIEARCHPNNIGSERVMQKSGMQFEGILRKHIRAKGRYEDVKMYAIINADKLDMASLK
ncbi:GNAT family N-acetyltransferase [Marinicrinis sediminis]|uniref:GNAT family N-acetyltransferase n=1 Tax=Marinicrinis sediminis TaxID=1652465 RepID=A0ABW5R8Y2_9BACL